MRPFRSIRWRLQIWYGLLFAGLLLSFGLTAYHFETTAREARFDDELSRLAFDLNGALRRPPDGSRLAQGKKSGKRPPETKGESPAPSPPPSTSPPPPPPTTSPPTGKNPRKSDPAAVFPPREMARGFYYAVWFKNAAPFTASANAPADLPQPPERELGARARVRGLYREAYVSADYGDVALVGRSFAAEQAELHRFGWQLALGGAAILAVAIVIGWRLVTRALRPIHDIGTTATKIATGDLSQRIDARETDGELGQLAGVLNSTFARLEAAFGRQHRFTADAAHELRTPVAVIVTHVQNALAAGGLSEEQREAMEACERAAQRMRRLIDSLLQLARIDAGEDAGKPGRTDLAALAAECAALVRPLAAERQATIVLELAAAEITGDAGRLGQVITNLLSNAIHYGRRGGEVRVTVRTEDNAAVLVVADDGPGIPAAHLPHLFERFYRVDKARAGAAGRTGLGLAIAKAIVDAHSGTIEIASIVDEGTTATVRLPRG